MFLFLSDIFVQFGWLLRKYPYYHKEFKLYDVNRIDKVAEWTDENNGLQFISAMLPICVLTNFYNILTYMYNPNWLYLTGLDFEMVISKYYWRLKGNLKRNVKLLE